MDPELEAFKCEIRLHEYAASLGYAVDPRESSRRETILRAGTDKISVRRDADGHYVYYSFRDERDNGTIIDFVQSRQAKTMGEVRKTLRPWLGKSFQQPKLPEFAHLDKAPRFDRAAVEGEYASMKDLAWHSYLEKDRALPRIVLTGPRFAGRIRVDSRANAVFPHFDAGGLCGFEKRNRTFKGFANLGQKGLWLSNVLPGDQSLVVGESAIDCISHHVLFPAPERRYASFAGGLNPEQPDLILQQLKSLSAHGELICITHDDEPGNRYANVLEETASKAGWTFVLDRPIGVKDWNDALCQGFSFPAALREPCR